MEGIHEPNDTFNFENLRLSKPIAQTSTGFLSKYTMNENPLYVQPPKCYVKQFANSKGKKMYCDLVFQHENEQFIHWIENLETRSHKLIHEKKDAWFNSDIDMGDIEECFVSPLKIYKSGRSYIVRTMIQSSLGKPQIKIYDENENDVSYEDVKEDTPVMVILEFNGIRCSTRSFQMEIEIKQMLVMKPKNLFNSCILIKENNDETKETIEEGLVVNDPVVNDHVVNDPVVNDLVEGPVVNDHVEGPVVNDLVERPVESVEDKDLVIENQDIGREDNQEEDQDEESLETQPIKIDTTEELCEVDLDLDEIDIEGGEPTEVISIKNKNDVYYKMYKEAREKAKVARDLALSAYLEAKRIKNEYMLDVDSDSDSEEDEGDEEDQ